MVPMHVWSKISLATTCALALQHPRALGSELPTPYEGVRPLGMGNAMTALADDDNAPFYNPAGINKSHKAWSRGTFNYTRFPNIVAGANSAGQAFAKDYKKDTAEQIASKTDLIDAPFWTRAGAFPFTVINTGGRPSNVLSFGIYTNTVARALIESTSTGQAQVEAISDAGGVIGYGVANRNNRFTAGIQARPVYRYAYEDIIPTATLFDKSALQKRFKEDANKGLGFGVDAGVQMTFADFWFPTLGVAVLNLPTGCKADYLNPYSKQRENVCGTVFHGTFANPDAVSSVDPTDIRIGIAATPRFSRQLNMRLALDMHHIAIPAGSNTLGLNDVDTRKLVHGGAEIFWGNPLLPDPEWAVRLGANQGFITFGGTARVGILAFDLAIFGVDVSNTKTPKEDRRFISGLTLEF